MPNLPGATLPFVPFPEPLPIPTQEIGDSPLVCVTINQEWLSYLVGCAQALVAESTWASTVDADVKDVIRRAQNLIGVLSGFEACPMAIEFREKPGQGIYWQYSQDGGASWDDGPHTADNFTPEFSIDILSASGWKLSVNQGISNSIIPIMDGVVNDVVRTAPLSDATNLVDTSSDANRALIALDPVGRQVNILALNALLDLALDLTGASTETKAEIILMRKTVADVANVIVTELVT